MYIPFLPSFEFQTFYTYTPCFHQNPNSSGHQYFCQKRQPKYSTFFERVKEELKIEDVLTDLTAASYKEKFHKLLCWEEKEHITVLHERYVHKHVCIDLQPVLVCAE